MAKVRDVIDRAYSESKVIGIGLSMTSKELQYGVDIFNGILDELYLDDLAISKVVANANVSGRVLTIGTQSFSANDGTDDIEVSPDILVTSTPERIEALTIIRGNSRYQCKPMSDLTYFDRGIDDNTQTPNSFYYNPYANYDLANVDGYVSGEQTDWGTINFIGAPSGAIELMYNIVFQNLNANTDLVNLPRAMKPYLTHELAYRLADENGLGDTAMAVKKRSNLAYRKMVNSTAGEATNDSDPSGIIGGGNRRADYNESMKQIDRGY